MEEKSATEITAVGARRAYQREWYSKNKEKIRERQQRYWQRKADAMNAAALIGREAER